METCAFTFLAHTLAPLMRVRNPQPCLSPQLLKELIASSEETAVCFALQSLFSLHLTWKGAGRG